MKNLKHLPISFDAKAVKDDGSFEGYASTFGNVDAGYDVVMPGAFAQSLKVRPAPAIKMLWQHDPAQPIGVWHAVSEDTKGLHVKGTLLIGQGVPRADEARALMKAGVIDSMSIGFKTLEADFDKSGVRQLKEIGLYEISLVTFPMNDQAVVTMKDFNPRDAEKSLRDAGLSRSDAVKAVAYFRELLRDAGENVAIDPREAEAATIPADMADAMRKLQAAFR